VSAWSFFAVLFSPLGLVRDLFPGKSLSPLHEPPVEIRSPPRFVQCLAGDLFLGSVLLFFSDIWSAFVPPLDGKKPLRPSTFEMSETSFIHGASPRYRLL